MLTEINTSFFLFLNSFSATYGFLDVLLQLFAGGLGIALMLSTVALVFMRERKNKKFLRIVAHISAPVFIALIYTELLKELYQIPRPWVALESVRLLFEYGGTDSFPSGHATTYGALATSVYFYSRRFGLALGVVALFISLSRVVVGIHWPFDIATGFAVGFLVSYAYNIFVLKTRHFKNNRAFS